MTGRRVFYLHEIQRLIHAENIVTAYEASKRSTNWAEWSQSNPKLAAILFDAMKAAGVDTDD